MSSPALSVVLPTYERRELTLKAIHSVLRQTRQDFELLVVDGESKDGTAAAVDGLDPRLTLISRRNAGVSPARNAALARATAPVVAFLDSDNEWLPDHAETVLALLDRHPEAVAASTCPDFVVAGGARVERADVRDVLAESLMGGRTGYTTCIAARRWAIERAGGFDERMPVLEDTDLWVRLAMLGPFALLRRRTIVRQATEGSLMDRGRRDRLYFAALERHGLKVATLLEATPGREHLARASRANAAVARALAALDAGDDHRAGAMLGEACDLQPELHVLPGITAHRLAAHVPASATVRGRALIFSRCARAWPDPDALTARWLRLGAAGMALRAREPRIAASALRDWPLRGSIRFAARLGPPAARRATLRARDRYTRGVEPGAG